LVLFIFYSPYISANPLCFSGNVTAYGGSSLFTTQNATKKEPIFLDDYHTIIEWVSTASSCVRSSAGIVTWHTGVGSEDFVDAFTLIAQEATAIVINNDKKEILTLEYYEYNQGTGGVSLIEKEITLTDSSTLIETSTFDVLAVLEYGIAEINNNSTLNLLGIITDTTSILKIPSGTILILPETYTFYGEEIELKGTIVGAQNLTLKNSAILKLYTNASWMSYSTYVTYKNSGGSAINSYNFSSINLEDQSGIIIMGGDYADYSTIYCGDLKIR
jgi:hypothetical protein